LNIQTVQDSKHLPLSGALANSFFPQVRKKRKTKIKHKNFFSQLKQKKSCPLKLFPAGMTNLAKRSVFFSF
jgi:hypothetical protein